MTRLSIGRALAGLCVAFIAMAALGLAPAKALTTDEIISRGKVIIAIDTTTAPYGMVDTSMEPTGFDIEVANLVGKALGVPVEFVTVTSPGRIPSLLTNRVDMVISIFSITPERALQVAFSIPYAGQSSVVLAPKSLDIKGPEDLVGLKVGVTRGTGEDGLLTAQAEKFPGIEILRFDDYASITQAMLQDRIPASFSAVAPRAGLIRIATLPDARISEIRRVAVEGSGLSASEYRIEVPTATQLDERLFLDSALGTRIFSVTADRLDLKAGETARVIIVRRGEGL